MLSTSTQQRFAPAFLGVALLTIAGRTAQAEPLPDTKPLDTQGDVAAKMVDGIHKYLDRAIAESVEKRKEYWKPNLASLEAYLRSVRPQRERLKKIVGVVDERVKFDDIEYVGGPKTPSLVAEEDQYKVYAVRWPVLPGVDGEGLLLEPKDKVVGQVIAIPDADQTPEQIVGLAEGVAKEFQFARRLAEDGCRVLVPVLIDRKDTFSGSEKLNRWTNQPHREFVYRMAYEMGRHIIGYEVQKVLAAVDWFDRGKKRLPTGVWGYGEGGLIAFLSAAVDERIEATFVDGYFGPREQLWEEPIYRNVWSYLQTFGDAEVGTLIFPRAMVIGPQGGPIVAGPPTPRNGRGGAAPGRIEPASIDAVKSEFDRLMARATEIGQKLNVRARFDSFYGEKDPGYRPQTIFERRLTDSILDGKKDTAPVDKRTNFDPSIRQRRQFDQLVAFTQKLWRDSDSTRRNYWQHAKPTTANEWEAACDINGYYRHFHEETIGKLPEPTMPLNPRTRQIYDEPKWTGHEVMLDVYPDVFAYGVVLLPKDMKSGEKRPVVVCQHGLEGRPTDTTNPKERTKYYNSFAAQLADLGYIVYAPQNPYIGQTHFRQIQRKAQPLKASLFSFIIRQHQRTIDWLETLPNVDPKRIAFYGLSYGGKTAMRVPAVEKRYCLSICSGDFNEWIGKNVSVDFAGSYMWTIEYDMYEFDLGNTFNYAEMAYLIAPRPFMVERGHDDGVGIDEMIAYEYAKVRYFYANRLKIADRTEIEWFVGHHEINGKGTFAFLKRHLDWPK